MKIAKGIKQNGIVVGNAFDKYNSKNIIVRALMRGFENSLIELVSKANPSSIHELGCGEAYWCIRWIEQGINARGSDYSSKIIELARLNAVKYNISPDLFNIRDIYNVDPFVDSADLIVCCEVLEHIEKPNKALQKLQSLKFNHLILSVPREPLWSLMNLARGKYIRSFGNTPGHIQQWSTIGIQELISRYFEIVEVRTPIPWTMMLCKPYLR